MRSRSEINVGVPHVKTSCTIELDAAVLAEIDVQYDFLPRSGAIRRWRERKILGRIGKKCERISGEELYDAASSMRTRYERIGRYFKLCSDLAVGTLGG